MKDWVNKEVITKALIIVLSNRFNPMSAVDVLDDISDIVKEDKLLSKADICREFAEKLKAEVKEQGVKGIIYGDGIESIDTSFDILRMIDKALAEILLAEMEERYND